MKMRLYIFLQTFVSSFTHKLFLISLVWVMLLPIAVIYAQQAPLMTHYYLNRFVFNPSHISTQDANQLHLIYRNQWAGLQGAPETFLLTYQHALPTKKMGLGATLKRENLNLIAQTSALLSYAYLVNINTNQKLSFGLSLGTMYSSINWDKVMLEDLIDPRLYSNDDQFRADGNFGVLYTYHHLQLGLGVQHLFARGASTKFDLNNTFLRYANHSIFSASYKIKPKKGDWTIEPIFLYRFANNFPGQIDISIVAEWKGKAWTSLGYRNSYGYALSAGVRISEQVRVSYAYEIANRNVGVASNGTHEIMLNYSFKKKKNPATDSPKEIITDTPSQENKNVLPEKYQSLQVGQPHKLTSIKFGNNSSELDKDNLQELDELAEMLRNNTNIQVEIGAHTDNTIESNLSKTLTQKRAEAIGKYLNSKGVKKYQLSLVGYGSSRPLAGNDDEINNNRIEIKLLKM
jgi:type IX secretion system PorP/SprF family membrane protein